MAKIRTGFVSNSSSSSFILAITKERANETITIPIDITSCVDEQLTTKKELDKWFHGNYIVSEDETIEQFLEEESGSGYGDYDYPAMVKAIESGKVILVGSGSSEGDSAADLAIYYGAISTINDSDIEVIQDDS